MPRLIGFALLASALGFGSYAYLGTGYETQQPSVTAERDTATITVKAPTAAAPAGDSTTTRVFSPRTPAFAVAAEQPLPQARPAQDAAPSAWTTTVQADGAPKMASAKPGDDESRRELTRNLQRELKRVGCYTGEVSGAWTAASKRAMTTFVERINATLPVDQPDYILLTLVQGHTGQACGASCPSGQTMSDAGRCVPNAVVAHAVKKEGQKIVAKVKLADRAERQAAEAKRQADERAAADARRTAEEKRLAEERRAAEDKRIAEQRRIAEEKRQAQARKLAQAKAATSIDSAAPSAAAAPVVAVKPAEQPAGRMAIGGPKPDGAEQSPAAAPLVPPRTQTGTAPAFITTIAPAPVVVNKAVAAHHEQPTAPDPATSATAASGDKAAAVAGPAAKRPKSNIAPVRVTRPATAPRPQRYASPYYVTGPSYAAPSSAYYAPKVYKKSSQRQMIYNLFERPDRGSN